MKMTPRLTLALAATIAAGMLHAAEVTPEQAKEEREQEKREVDGEVSAHGWDDGGDTDYNEQGND